MNTKPSRRLAACLCTAAFLSPTLWAQETNDAATATHTQAKVEEKTKATQDPQALVIINRAAEYIAKAPQYQAT